MDRGGNPLGWIGPICPQTWSASPMGALLFPTAPPNSTSLPPPS